MEPKFKVGDIVRFKPYLDGYTIDFNEHSHKAPCLLEILKIKEPDFPCPYKVSNIACTCTIEVTSYDIVLVAE